MTDNPFIVLMGMFLTNQINPMVEPEDGGRRSVHFALIR